MKKNVLILAAALALAACGGNAQRKAATADSQETVAAAPDMHTAETSLDYLGTYEASIPQAFGVHGSAMGGEDFLYPNRTRTGIEIMSINLLLPNETDPVVWRGPVIAGAVTQFWTDVQWENVNYMFVDMPPGTGDVPLTVFQSLPVAGVVVVTSPQELVGMIVDKAVNMADMMHVPVLGIVENMAYYTCPDCGKQHAIFGESHIEAIAAKHGIPNTAKLPIDPAIAAACDAGRIEDVQGDWLSSLADAIEGK